MAEVYSGPAVVELMGHRRLVGYVQEVEMFGARLLRLDMPSIEGEHGPITQFYGGGAIYCITPTTEELVERLADSNSAAPVSRYELPVAADDDGEDREPW